MSLLLRKSSAQALKEGWVQVRADDDYCVVENERVVGASGPRSSWASQKGRWAINGVPHGLPPHNGGANMLDDAKAAFKKRYEEITSRSG